jgi:hypothetical protein
MCGRAVAMLQTGFDLIVVVSGVSVTLEMK